MKAPCSPLFKHVKSMYGGYAITRSVTDNISVNEAHDKLVREGVNPWTARKMSKDEINDYFRKKKLKDRKKKLEKITSRNDMVFDIKEKKKAKPEKVKYRPPKIGDTKQEVKFALFPTIIHGGKKVWIMFLKKLKGHIKNQYLDMKMVVIHLIYLNSHQELNFIWLKNGV